MIIESDSAKLTGWKSFADSLKRLSSVRRFVNSRSSTEPLHRVVAIKSITLSFIRRDQHFVWIPRIQLNVDDPGFVVDVEDFSPSLPAISCFEQSTFFVGAP